MGAALMRCDSHVHIVGATNRYPQVPERTYLAAPAALDELKRRGAARGITRFVIVQPSFYGFDNSATLDALDALAGNGRGVAVIDPLDTPDDELADMARRGVRGLRINLYSPLSARKRLVDSFDAMTSVARRMGWHVQVIAPLVVLLENENLLLESPVPVVIDHYGVYGRATPDSENGLRLLNLLRAPHVWLKLSAPYRLNDGPLSTRPDRAWLAAILDVAAERCVWGSDWPHPPPVEWHVDGGTITPYRDLSYEALVDEFLAALPPPAFGEPILRDNPARLYSF